MFFTRTALQVFFDQGGGGTSTTCLPMGLFGICDTTPYNQLHFEILENKLVLIMLNRFSFIHTMFF